MSSFLTHFSKWKKQPKNTTVSYTHLETFKNGAVFFGTLAGASEVHVQADKAGIADDAVSAVIPQATIYIPFAAVSYTHLAE